jgi:hypothetical protein
MYEMTITLDNQQDVEDLLAVLSEAEEEGELNFSFGVATKELTRREIVERCGFRLRK